MDNNNLRARDGPSLPESERKEGEKGGRERRERIGGGGEAGKKGGREEGRKGGR